MAIAFIVLLVLTVLCLAGETFSKSYIKNTPEQCYAVKMNIATWPQIICGFSRIFKWLLGIATLVIGLIHFIL